MTAVRLTRVCGHSFLGGLLSPDSVVFDLGANCGEFAREVHRQFGCQVHAVEPSSELGATLQASAQMGSAQIASTRMGAALRGPEWLTVTEAAVSPRSGRGWLVASENPEAGHLEEAERLPQLGDASRLLSVGVPMLTLKELLENRNTPKGTRIDLMKMDIEGTELEVLESAPEETLRRIRQLTVEFHQFLNPALRGRIQALKCRLDRLGFWSMDFSRCNYDVLFASHQLGVSRLARLELTAQKYGAMAGRLASGARAHYFPGAASTARSPIL